MGTNGESYERELKALLSGDGKAIAKMVRTCDALERARYESMISDPFLVIRGAGSFGVDLVALRWDVSVPIEVKSSADDVLHFSKNQRLTEQAEAMLEECTRSNLVPVYAYRLKSVRGDPWRLFTIPCDHRFRGRQEILYRRLPKLEVSGNGFYIMRWADGMKLSEFMGYVGADGRPEDRGDPVRTHRAHHLSASGRHHPGVPAGNRGGRIEPFRSGAGRGIRTPEDRSTGFQDRRRRPLGYPRRVLDCGRGYKEVLSPAGHFLYIEVVIR